MQAAIFYLPFKLWTMLEANTVASFGTDGKSPVMLSEDAKYDDGVVQVKMIVRHTCTRVPEYLYLHLHLLSMPNGGKSE